MFANPHSRREADVAWAVRMGDYTVTSPNVRAIPFMPTGLVSLRMRSDGRYGEHDFTICPQVFSADHVHRVLVRNRQSPLNSHLECIWWTPTIADFERFPNSAYADLGRCSCSRLLQIDDLGTQLKIRMVAMSAGSPGLTRAKLETLATTMRSAILNLCFHSYTFHEMLIGVAYAQRLYLDALAYSDYIAYRFEDRMNASSVSVSEHLSHVLGASSSDVAVVNRLQIAGVPAYLVVPHDEALALGATRVESISYTPQLSFDTREWVHPVTSKPMPLLYTGQPSSVVHDVVTRAPQYASLERYFLGLDDKHTIVPIGVRGIVCTSSVQPAASKRKNNRGPKKIPGTAGPALSFQRDKWTEITGDYISPTLPGWSYALKQVDRSARSAVVAPKMFTGYRFPDPGMIMYSELRRERNVFAWLVSRSANLRRLINDLQSADPVPVGVSNELWRVYLGTDVADSEVIPSNLIDRSTAAMFNGRGSASQRRQAAVSIFGRPPDKFNLQEATWRGHTIRWGTVFQHNPQLVQEIIWDLHWSSFRFDLIALDRYLAPGQWETHKYARSDALCTVFGTVEAFLIEDGCIENAGIASPDAFERERAYSAFAFLMHAWPCSSSVHTTSGSNSADAIAFRYCSTFAYTFGRPPVLPKLVPVAHKVMGIIPYPD